MNGVYGAYGARMETEIFTEEVCPYCEREARLMWDVRKDGYRAYCPHCGKPLMLCNECYWRTGQYVDDCDYDGTGCRFDRPEGPA